MASTSGQGECDISSCPAFGGAPRAMRLEGVAHMMVEGAREKPVLARLSRSFEAGAFHVVGGPSGAGKTTLLSILALAVRPTQGMVLWGDTNLTQLRPAAAAEWRRRELGLVFQTSRLVSVMSVREHIRLAAAIRGDRAVETEGLRALDALGMTPLLDQRPGALSGGEKQRVAIAQVLGARPSVLLADEPTAALDQTNAALVAHTLRTFARERGAAVICVSHDRVVMDAADHLLMLEKA